MNLETFAGIVIAANILFGIWGVMVLAHPQWSEHYGRQLLSHAQALRDFYALFRKARQAYVANRRDWVTELEKVTY